MPHGRLMDDVDAVSLRERLIAMGERFERPKTGKIEVAEEAGRITRFRLDQRDIETWSEPAAKYLATVAPPTPPPITTTRALAWPRAIRGASL